jgi:hypothetical protein
MRRITKTINSANTGTIGGTTITGGFTIAMNFNNTAVAVGFVTEVAGTVNYTVYHTYDDVLDPTIPSANIVWLPHGVSNMVGATTTQESNFVVPISGIQVVINSGGTGGDGVKIVILQQGII